MSERVIFSEKWTQIEADCKTFRNLEEFEKLLLVCCKLRH